MSDCGNRNHVDENRDCWICFGIWPRQEISDLRRALEECRSIEAPLLHGSPTKPHMLTYADRKWVPAAERDAALAQVATLREALELEHPLNAAARYDLIADDFEAATGFTAPGRSLPLGMDSVKNDAIPQWRMFVNSWHEHHFDTALKHTAEASRAYVARVRSETLEEAAKVAEDVEALLPAATSIPERIRALASRTEPGEQGAPCVHNMNERTEDGLSYRCMGCKAVWRPGAKDSEGT